MAVLAGTGSDPTGRVAYVKTVHADTPQPGVVQPSKTWQGRPHTDTVSDDGDATVTHLVVAADINTDNTVL